MVAFLSGSPAGDSNAWFPPGDRRYSLTLANIFLSLIVPEQAPLPGHRDNQNCPRRLRSPAKGSTAAVGANKALLKRIIFTSLTRDGQVLMTNDDGTKHPYNEAARRIKAALVSYRLGRDGVDYTLKQMPDIIDPFWCELAQNLLTGNADTIMRSIVKSKGTQRRIQ